jgi:3'-phosphoadenosine 5'-phosphosulfate sulfotransferase (PAPS reductase)/FAD synthetase
MIKVVVQFSGGKDSTAAILKVLEKYPKDEALLVYEDTGADFVETEPHVKLIAGMVGLPLVILKGKEDYFDLVRRYQSFPSPASRWCTRKLKMDEIRRYIAANRSMFSSELIVVTGIRADESPARAKMGAWRLDDHLTTKNQMVKFWAPCLELTEVGVKEYVTANGLPLHPCYQFSRRANCWNCFFAPNHSVRAYAEMHPELWEKACIAEDEIRFKWKDGFAINDLMKQGKLL